jgi:5-oxoprolinase (ATP-hydrolysing)
MLIQRCIALGGGSILSYRNGLFLTGTESAGALPGPVAYRKGGPLTVTDANLVLGRLQAGHFPNIFGVKENEPLDYDGALAAFEKLLVEVNTDLKTRTTKKALNISKVAL